MKAQTVLVQFILFFVLNIIILTSLGYFFSLEADIFKEDIIKSHKSLIASYVSSISISLLDSCKRCTNGTVYFKIPNTTAGYYIEIIFTDNQPKIISQPATDIFYSSMHNLNETLLLDGFAYSINLISLTLEKNKNILVIS